MRQFTTPDQTAKLIELGFEKPSPKWVKDENGDYRVKTNDADYDIGELIEMLPSCIAHPIWWGDEIGEEGVWGLRIDSGGTEYGWEISYERHNSAYLYRGGRSEMIDALYDMCIELEEEGVI